MNKLVVCAVALLLLVTGSMQGAIIQFDLLGKAGAGLLAGNENSAVAMPFGSGGELGVGISYDDVTNILTMNTGWGSGNGFTNLSGNSTLAHLHGPTASVAPASFLENAGVKYDIHTQAGYGNNASAGGFIGVLNILQADEMDLLTGRFYMNVHTGLNGGGEIRGQLVVTPVPEPTSIALTAIGGVALLMRRRKSKLATETVN